MLVYGGSILEPQVVTFEHAGRKLKHDFCLASACRWQVLATNHVFGILSRAMASGGDLEKVERKSLPPRKRAGWTGGDDRPQKKTPSDEPATCEDGCRESDVGPLESELRETDGDEKEP